MNTEPDSDCLLEPAVGQCAPQIVVTGALDGLPYCLADLWSTGPAVLVFLRHLGCTFCREHVAQLRDDLESFTCRSATIGLLTPARHEETAVFCRERGLIEAFTCLCDPERSAYIAYGLSRSPAGELFSRHVLARGIQAALHGHFAGIPKGDPFQLPGTFVVDASGTLRFAHRNRDMADNPPNSALLEVLDRMSPGLP